MPLPQLSEDKSEDHQPDDDHNYAYGQWYTQMPIDCCFAEFPVVAQITCTNQISIGIWRRHAGPVAVALALSAVVLLHGIRRSSRGGQNTLQLCKAKWKAEQKEGRL